MLPISFQNYTEVFSLLPHQFHSYIHRLERAQSFSLLEAQELKFWQILMEADSFRDTAHRKRLITETDAQKTALSQGASNNINPNYPIPCSKPRGPRLPQNNLRPRHTLKRTSLISLPRTLDQHHPNYQPLEVNSFRPCFQTASTDRTLASATLRLKIHVIALLLTSNQISQCEHVSK